jgi:ABC-type thiamine transport system ATPase subunit
VKKKPGRPPVSKKLAKGALLSVRFSESERGQLERAAQTAGLKSVGMVASHTFKGLRRQRVKLTAKSRAMP